MHTPSATDPAFRRLVNACCCPQVNKVETGFRPNLGGGFFHPGSDLLSELTRFKAEAGEQVLCTGDMECGPGGYVQGEKPSFGCMAGLGAIGDTDLAYQVGRATALYARKAGYHWTLAPCVDTVEEIDSPMAGLRSAGKDFDTVRTITSAYARGLQDHGLIATAKHFPGDGSTTWDQHVTTPQLKHTLEEWRNGPGKVFQTLIDDGVRSIMPGHIALPSVDPGECADMPAPPATCSRKLLTGLLREEMGFKGMIVSDAFGMGGVIGYMNYYEALAAFWEAGGDMVLFPIIDDFLFQEIAHLIGAGRLRTGTLEKAAARIDEQRRWAFGQPSLTDVDLPDFSAWEDKAAEGCIRVLRDRNGILPLKLAAGARVLHVWLQQEPGIRQEALEGLDAALGERFNVERWCDPGPDKLFYAARGKAFDAILVSVCCPPSYGTNVIRLHGPLARNMMGGWMHFDTPVVFLAHQHPFFHEEYNVGADCVVNLHSLPAKKMTRLVKRLMGF